MTDFDKEKLLLSLIKKDMGINGPLLRKARDYDHLLMDPMSPYSPGIWERYMETDI